MKVAYENFWLFQPLEAENQTWEVSDKLNGAVATKLRLCAPPPASERSLARSERSQLVSISAGSPFCRTFYRAPAVTRRFPRESRYSDKNCYSSASNKHLLGEKLPGEPATATQKSSIPLEEPSGFSGALIPVSSLAYSYM